VSWTWRYVKHCAYCLIVCSPASQTALPYVCHCGFVKKLASPSIANTMARFNDVHASGYNSAVSKRICMKFGALGVYCLEPALTDFGRDPLRSESG